MADEMKGWPDTEKGVVPAGPGPVPDRVEPETGIEPDEEVAAERVETFEGEKKDDGPAPSGP